jgi:hypothetical protein
MGEQEKNVHFINIMGHVIYIFHSFLKLFSSKVNFLCCVGSLVFFIINFKSLSISIKR